MSRGTSGPGSPAAVASSLSRGEEFDQQLQLHQEEINKQDELLDDMSTVVGRLTEMGREMNAEIEIQGQYVLQMPLISCCVEICVAHRVYRALRN